MDILFTSLQLPSIHSESVPKVGQTPAMQLRQTTREKMHIWNFIVPNFSKLSYKFNHIYFTWIKKQVLTTYTNLFRFCFLGTTPVLAQNVSANEKIPKLRSAPGTQTWDLKIARPTLYLTTTEVDLHFIWI